MLRKAIEVARSDNGKRIVCIDSENYEAIERYIQQDNRHAKKFRHIVSIILEGLRNRELYDKEEIDNKSRGVTVMKFFKGQENDRLYCKQFTNDGSTFVVVAAELLRRKKSQGNTPKIKNLIHKVAKYEYEVEKEKPNNAV